MYVPCHTDDDDIAGFVCGYIAKYKRWQPVEKLQNAKNKNNTNNIQTEARQWRLC